MNRFLLACLLIIVLLLALITIILVPHLSSSVILMPHPSSPENLALSIALSDPGVRSTIANYNGNYNVVSVTPQGQADSGYINVNDSLYIVNLTMPNPVISYGREIIIVDLNQCKVLCNEWYSYRGIPVEFDIMLPADASYYHILSGPIWAGSNMGDEFGVQSFWYHLGNLTPKDAKVYPILVDEANLSLMKTGGSYQAAVYNDTTTNLPTVMNGSYAIYPGWSVNASVKRSPAYNTSSWPAFDMSHNYYLVLKNAGTDTVNINLEIN